MIWFILFNVLVLALLLSVGGWLVRVAARRSRPLATVVGVLGGIAALVLWPIPSREGFSFLGAELYAEFFRSRPAIELPLPARKRPAQTKPEVQRFRGYLEFVPQTKLSDTWQQVQVEGGGTAWLDSGHQLLWSTWLPLQTQGPMPGLELAKRRCTEQPPQGFWALANEAEASLLWQAGGQQWLPPAPGSTLSYNADPDTQFEMPAYHLHRLPGGGGQKDGFAPFSVRCVALAEGAPPNGYQASDIPLADWNRYQLQKLQP